MVSVFASGLSESGPVSVVRVRVRIGRRMETRFSGIIAFRNFGHTSRGCPNIPENRNNWKILFLSTITARA